MNWPTSIFISSAILAVAAIYIYTFDKQVEQALVIQPRQTVNCKAQEKTIVTLQNVLALKDKQCQALIKVKSDLKRLHKDSCYADWETGDFYGHLSSKTKAQGLICYFDNKTRTWKKELIQYKNKIMEKL